MAFGIHDHPFYKPKYRRVLMTASTALWAAFEVFIGKDGMWTAIAVAVFVYCLWFFIIAWKDAPPTR